MAGRRGQTSPRRPHSHEGGKKMEKRLEAYYTAIQAATAGKQKEGKDGRKEKGKHCCGKL